MFTGTEKHGWQCCFSYTLTQDKLTSMQPSMVSLGPHSFFLKHMLSQDLIGIPCVNMQFSNYMYCNYIHNVLSNALEITTDYWRFSRGIQRIL